MSSSSATLTFEPRPPPRARRRAVPNGVVAMLMFVFTEAMLFAGLISAFIVIRSAAAGQMWPPYGQPRLPFERTAINTTALLVSGVVLVFAQLAFRKQHERARIPVLIAIVLGGFFVGFQGVEWLALIRQGLTLQSSSYGSFFYLIVGAHAVHAVAALGGLVWAWVQLLRKRLTQSAFATVQVFWYFVVIIWPVIYFKVYLS